AFLTDSGAGQPLGVLNAPATVSVSKETGQAANTIVYENVVKMWSRMWPRGHQNAVWVGNPDIMPALYSMNLAIGTAGVPVFMPANGAAPSATLFGRPLLFSEKVPTLGTVGDLGLYDLTQYAIGLRAEVALMISPHAYFVSDELAFRLRVRIDGSSLWDAAVTPAKGSNTISPFVVLATRA
ncbi:MAG TPA: phage major capsid protein, partial [Bryobacterales bacterium]|nr:phage major capsid protein [Bryobacterales bacterium]